MFESLKNLYSELRRRRVFRVATVYAGVAFIIFQIIDATFDTLGIPVWMGKYTIVILILGFPIATVLAWAFDVTDRGIIRTKDKAEHEVSRKPLVSNTGLIAITAIAILLAVWAWWGPAEAENQTFESIAVLPLDNYMGDTQQDYFVDGMTESIIAELARIEGLRVISRTSAMRFKGSEMSIIDIAKALNVDAIVEGSVLKADDMVRITAQLIDGDTDEHLWAKAFDRNLDQILNLQRDVARSIATEINMTLNPREEEYFSESKSVNTTAYQLYLKGWYHRLRETTESLALAYDYFSQALEIDPGLVEAHAAMVVMSYIGIGRGINDIEEGISDPKTFAKYSAEKAVSLNPGSPEAQLSMALYQQLFELDFTAAELSFKTALNLRPGDAELRREYGLYLTRMGRYAEAKAQLDLSYAADPMSQLVLRDLGTVNLRLGNIQVAHEQLKSSFELESGDRRTAMLLGLSYLALGDGDQSLQFFKDYKRENSIRFFEGEWLMMERVGLQEVLNAEADSLTEESEREEWRPYPKAIIAVLDKRYSDAFDYLEVVINEKSGRTVNILESVYFDPLIHLPRFKELLLRAGYPDVELKSISQLLDQINLSTE